MTGDYADVFEAAAPFEPYAIDIPDSSLVHMILHPYDAKALDAGELRKVASTLRLMNCAFWDELCARYDTHTAVEIFEAAAKRVEDARPR